jgi:hypothetical protein
LPPLGAWALALGTLCVTASVTGHAPFAPSTWERWDSEHYLSIAVDGYDVHRCAPGETDNGGAWCGNAAWFPGYPWTVAAVRTLRVPVGVAALAMAWALAAAALVLLWISFLRGLPRALGAAGMLYAAFAPGQVYDFAVFPISLFLVFEIASLAFLLRGRWLAAGATGFGGALTYPVGVITLPIVAGVYACRRAGVRAALEAAVPPLAGFGLIVVVQRLQTGRWTAFFDVQGRYGHGFHDPLGVTWNYVLELTRSSNPLSHTVAANWIVVLGTLVLVAVLAHGAYRWRRLGRPDALLLWWAVVAWAFPLTQANVSVWRSQAVLAPIAPLAAKLPRALAAAAIAAAAVVAVAAARLYFEGRLI